MKKITILSALLCIALVSSAQKKFYTNVELRSHEGTLIDDWKAKIYVLFGGDLLTVSSKDEKVLNGVCPQSVFDHSTFRSFLRVGSVDTLISADSLTTTYSAPYRSISHDNTVTVLSDSTGSYFVIVPNTQFGIVFFNKK
tara:strand:- start:706 stop:1125 length:420 start_codon:yes stop_codon:yes gene_type:complete